MRFHQQRAAFVRSIRDKSDSHTDERAQLTTELVEEKELIAAMQAKQQADEPKCEELRRDNAALTAKMMATKEIQEQTAAECEALKKDKLDVLRRKASKPIEKRARITISLSLGDSQ
jgi:kinetochore protein Nuf2